jgi:tetratricopeptide (TPR) repeat protein
LWEIVALREAIAKDPRDYNAKYFLGNFLYAHQQFEQAIKLWEDSLAGMADFDVLIRNLGLGYWEHKNDHVQAIDYFKKALAINPNNQDLYIHLDDLYRGLDQPENREELLQSILKLDSVREDVRKRTILIMVELGKYNKALDLLLNEEFVPLEMDQSFHDIYVKALIMRAGDYINANRITEAIDDLERALEFPRNLGVGRPVTSRNAEILYRLGCAYELQGNYLAAIENWTNAAREHHKVGDELFEYIQMSLDKLGRYSEIGFDF